jgi:Zn-finger nucleic acid-binding protein
MQSFLSTTTERRAEMESFTCDACGGTFKSKAELDSHVSREHAQQPSQKTPPGQEQKKAENR